MFTTNLGKNFFCVDLSQEKEKAIFQGFLAQEIINDSGYRKCFVIQGKHAVKLSPEFMHATQEEADAFYDHAKPLHDKMAVVREQNIRDIDNLWLDMGVKAEFTELAEQIGEIGK